MAPPRLAHVMIFVKNLAQAAEFYHRVFGLEPQSTSDPGFMVLGPPGERCIALHAIPASIAEQINITVPPRRRDDVAYKVCFEVADLEASRSAIIAAGGCADAPWAW